MLTESNFSLLGRLFRVPRRSRWASIAILASITTNGLAIDPNCTAKVDWTTLPSTYTHDALGNRVQQYAMGVEPVSNERPDFQRSGFRHTRSTLQAGNSSDNFHVVEKWGPPVQPYGEWRYPYRPYSVPYAAWGPQAPLVNAPQNNSWNFGNPGFPPGQAGGGNMGMPPMGPAMQNGMNGQMGPGVFPPGGMGPQGYWPGNYGPHQRPGFGNNGLGNNGFGVGPNNALRPDQDDYYAPAPEPPPVSDRDFFFLPNRP